jgi:glycosyltransferase involved in cell wall biosynthesis
MVRDLVSLPAGVAAGPPGLVYAGGLDQRNRNPAFLLEVFELLNSRTQAVVHFYSYGNCEELIRQGRYSSWLRAHGRVPPDEAEHAMRDADVHVTQANRNRELLPSKIFDCMSTGKPIIHFYHYNDDPYLDYLRRYGLGLAIRIGSDPQEAAQAIASFIESRGNERVSYPTLIERFRECTPEWFGKLVMESIR